MFHLQFYHVSLITAVLKLWIHGEEKLNLKYHTHYDHLMLKNKLSFAMISLRLEKFLNGVWNLYQNFHMVTALVLGFGILILGWIRSLVFHMTMLRILALYFDFEGSKNINVL